MTPPIPQTCSLCHDTPETPPNHLELVQLAQEEPGGLSENDCPAHDRWARGSRQLLETPERFWSNPWWIRHNYEGARNPTVPFRVDVQEAQISGVIPLNQGEYAVPVANDLLWGAYDAFDLEVAQGGKIQIHIPISENQIQTALLALLTSRNVAIDGPAWANFKNPLLCIGDFGQLHLIAETNPGVTLFTQPFMVPVQPPGTDLPPGDQLEEFIRGQAPQCFFDPYFARQQVGRCVQPPQLPPRNQIDAVLTQHLPEAFLTEQGRIPTPWDLEDFLTRLFGYLRDRGGSHRGEAASPEPPGGNPWVEFLEEVMAPGARLELEVAHLQDLFFPGILDLGPSSLLARLSVDRERQVHLEAGDFVLTLDPMDYPHQVSQCGTGLRLGGGQLLPGPIYYPENGDVFIPGINVDYDPGSGRVQAQLNLQFDVEAELPFLGPSMISGQVLARTEGVLGSHGLEIFYGTTQVEIRDLDIARPGEESNWLSEGHLSLRDGGPLPWGGEYLFELGGSLNTGAQFELMAHFYPQSHEGEAHAVLSDGEGRSWLARIPLRLHPDEEPHGSVGLELQELDPSGIKREIISGANLNFNQVSAPGGRRHWEVETDLSQLNVLGLIFRGLSTAVQVEQVKIGDRLTQVNLNFLGISTLLGLAGSRRQVGRASIQQDPDHEMSLFWDCQSRQLEVQDLHVEFAGSRLPLPARLRRFLDPTVHSWGVDGRLQGNFAMSLQGEPENWNGRGLIALRGDEKGDLYWFDRRGRRTGPPLVRDTRWCWREIRSINTRRGYALGRFYLEILANPQALMTFSEMGPSGPAPELISGDGRPLNPYEIQLAMPYDNQPATPRGFQNRIVDYLNYVQGHDPASQDLPYIAVERCDP